MSGGSLLSIGTRAMFANYAALQTTGHNIANANVAGYSRQQVELATADGQFSGAGFFGKGVDVAAVTRSHNEFLTREAAAADALASADAARAAQLERLEEVFPPGEAGLGFAANALLNSMVDLASQPADASTRQVVLARAQDMAQRFANAGAALDSLQSGLTQELEVSVAEVNRLSASIAQANEQIASLQALGAPPNDLLDQRDQLVSRLSQLVQVTTIAADDGSIAVFMGGGQRLVLGHSSATLSVVADEFDIRRSAIAIADQGVQRTLPSALVAGGALGGLLRFQNEDLSVAANELGRMAASLAGALNGQQALGLDQRIPPTAGVPLFSIGAPLALPAASNTKDAGGNFIGSVSVTVADPALLEASDYVLESDPANAGQWLLTRTRDGLVRSIASGDTVDGLTITPSAAAATDRFLLRPVARAAVDLRRALDDPRGLAAAAPLQASTGALNSGVATVASLAVVSAGADPQRTASIVFTSANGDYAWELRDRTTNALLGSGSATWQAGQPIALNGFELQLQGVPSAGDSFTVARTPYPAASNGNALALAALRDAALVGGHKVADAYASLMAGVGVKVQSARTAADLSAAGASQVHAQLEAQTGVNLDEEAARLIQFQQSYQAAAKVLQVAQTVFDTMLQTAGG